MYSCDGVYRDGRLKGKSGNPATPSKRASRFRRLYPGTTLRSLCMHGNADCNRSGTTRICKRVPHSHNSTPDDRVVLSDVAPATHAPPDLAKTFHEQKHADLEHALGAHTSASTRLHTHPDNTMSQSRQLRDPATVRLYSGLFLTS